MQISFFDTGVIEDHYLVETAENAEFTPGSFVRMTAARATADDLCLYGGGLTSELADLIQRTHRDVHLFTYLKREELTGSDRGTRFDRAAADARAFLITSFGMDDESAMS